MNNTDKQVTFGTMKRTRMCNTSDLSDEEHGLRQKYSTGICLYMKQPTVNVKVNGFRNKKIIIQGSHNMYDFLTLATIFSYKIQQTF
jgi:hypothetical protein